MKLTAKRLRELLHYDPETGVLTWIKSTRWNWRGKPAGYQSQRGYISLRIGDRSYSAHRLAFLYMKDRWPIHQVDHVNCIKNDNRWSNLREATKFQNCHNLKKCRGLLPKGVSKSTKENTPNPFYARISANNKRYYLGYFTTPEKAHAAYCEAAKTLHKEFARMT
jgi:hypothetical protein